MFRLAQRKSATAPRFAHVTGRGRNTSVKTLFAVDVFTFINN
jgi:hypothetical protein